MEDDGRTTQESLNKVFNLRPLIEERRKKRCSCKDRKFILDPINREVICKKCGQVVDPLDALLEIASKWELKERYLDAMCKTEERLAKWIVSHKEPLALKPFIEKYRQDLRPYCPHCNKMIDLYKIRSWGDKKFVERFEEGVCEKKDT